MGTWHNNNIGFYPQMKGLEDRLRKSEEERLKLEQKFDSLSRAHQADESAKLNTLRENYSKILKDDRMRCDRNETIMQTLERIESRASMLTAKTNRLKLLRKHYEAYISRLYPDWKKDSEDIQNPNSKQFHPNSSYLGASSLYSDPIHDSLYKPQSSPATRKSSIVFSETDIPRKMSHVNSPTIILTEPVITTVESSVLRNLSNSTPKSLFSPSNTSNVAKIKYSSEYLPYYKDHFKPEASPMSPLEEKHKIDVYDDAHRNFVSDNINRIYSSDRDQNTSGDLLSTSLSDDSNIKDLPKDLKPDYSVNLGKYQTNRWDHLAKAPTFSNKFSIDKKYSKSSEHSPLSPTFKKPLSRTPSFDVLSKYEQDRNKYGYPAISRRQSLSSDNLDLYKPKAGDLDKSLNFGKYSSSINSDDYVFKKYLVRPNSQLEKKYEDKYIPSSEIYLPGKNLLERKSNVDHSDIYNKKFDRDFQVPRLPYVNFDDRLSYLGREKLYSDVNTEKERCRTDDRLSYQKNESPRDPYYYNRSDDLLDYKYRIPNLMTESSAVHKDKTYFDNFINDREFEEQEFKNNVLSKQDSFGKINEETHQMRLNDKENMNESINLSEIDVNQFRNRPSLLSDEMECLTEKLNQSVKTYLNSSDDSKSDDKSYDFSETNPNILSATTSFAENMQGVSGVGLPKKDFVRSTEDNIKRFPKNVTNKITEFDEDIVDHSNKPKVKFELPPKVEVFRESEELDPVKILKEQLNLSENDGDRVLQNSDIITKNGSITLINGNSAEDPSSSIDIGKQTPITKTSNDIKRSSDVSKNKLNEIVVETNEEIKTSDINYCKEEKTEPKDNHITLISEHMQNKEDILKPSLEFSDCGQIEKENKEKDLPIVESITVNVASTNEKELNSSNIEDNLKTQKFDVTDDERLSSSVEGKLVISSKEFKNSEDEEKQTDGEVFDGNNTVQTKDEIENLPAEEEHKHLLVKNDLDQHENETQFIAETSKIVKEQENYELHIQKNEGKEFPNDQQEHYHEGGVENQQYYADHQEQDQTTYDENKLYFEDNNYHPGADQAVKEKVMPNTADQQYYEENPQQYYGDQVNTDDQHYYERDPQFVDQQYYGGDNQDKQFYEGTTENVDQEYQKDIAHPVDPQAYEETTVGSNQYYEETTKDGDKQSYQEGYSDQQLYEGGTEGIDQQYHDGKYYEGNVDGQYIAGDVQHTDEGQYYGGNEENIQSDVYPQEIGPNPNDQQYYGGNPVDGQYYEEEHDQNYPQEGYDNQQYYDQYAEGGVPVDYNKGQQYAEGGVPSNYNKDQQYTEGGVPLEYNEDQQYVEGEVPGDYNKGQQYAEGVVPLDYNEGQQYAEGGVPLEYNDDQQYAEGGVPGDYNDGQQYAEGGVPLDYSKDQQYAEGGVPLEYNKDQQYAEGGVPGDYDDGQQYAEGGVAGDYNQEQQYADGGNYQYDYDKTYPEGYEHYPQDGSQYQEQYDPGSEYYPEGSGAQEHYAGEHDQEAIGVADPGYSPSQKIRPAEDMLVPTSTDNEQLDITEATTAVVEDKPKTKKQTSLSKVLDSDSESIKLGAEQNINDDSSDFDFSSEKK